MVGAEFAKKGKTFNLIHQASQLKRKAVILPESSLTQEGNYEKPGFLNCNVCDHFIFGCWLWNIQP
jgi:hypothetical protein